MWFSIFAITYDDLTLMNGVEPQQSLFDLWRQYHYVYKEQYQSHQTSYIPNLLPEIAVQLNVYDVFGILQRRLGTETLQKALDPNQTIESPVRHHQDGNWLKTSNMVGINVRTIDSFFNVVKYVLTIPKSQDSIHLLPIWEPGVVGSLYGKVSFNINPEFYSEELARAVPSLNTVEKQLKVSINLLHAMGKSVGMDVIPHNDRFSELVIAYPRFFEWVRRVGGRITSNSESLYREVEEIIWHYIGRNGTANGTSLSFSKNTLFSPEIPILTDAQRFEIIFGHVSDPKGRLRRRVEIMQDIINQGYETLPMTMAPPYRGLHINPDDYILDENGNRWYTYEFDEPQAMSRVFGPLTRYKLFHSKDDNANWQLDFDNPQKPVWDYICKKYYECQQKFGFDFMRGDMAHIQPRPDGVPDFENLKSDIPNPKEYYDPLLSIKKFVQKQGVPYFAFFAETFLVEPDYMGFGNELDHLEAIEAEATLGDLQSSVVGSGEFMQKFVDYYSYLKNRQFAPNYTIITADKDDPRFDEFFRTANHLRFFVGLFLTDMPSYMGLGFEVRNLHIERGANEEYSKLYVFNIQDDAQTDKVTHGPFVWGQNYSLFWWVEKMRELSERIWDDVSGKSTKWLLEPTLDQKLMIWTTAENPKYIFVANNGTEYGINEDLIWQTIGNQSVQLIFDTTPYSDQHICRIYEVR